MDVGHSEDGLGFALTVLSQCALRPVDVRCPACRFGSRDEERVVEAMARLRTNEPRGAWLVVEHLLPSAAARIMRKASE